MLLQREAVGRRIAHAELQLRLGTEPAIGEIAARLRARARLQGRLEEFRGKLDHVMQRLALLLAHLVLARDFRHRHAGHDREPLDRFRESRRLRSS